MQDQFKLIRTSIPCSFSWIDRFCTDVDKVYVKAQFQYTSLHYLIFLQLFTTLDTRFCEQSALDVLRKTFKALTDEKYSSLCQVWA